MSNDEFEYVAEKLTNDTMLENDLMPMILGSAKFYSNEFKRNNMEGK
jgi:hypothetical protein